MKHLRSFNEEYKSLDKNIMSRLPEILSECRDILLELKDDGFVVKVLNNTAEYYIDAIGKSNTIIISIEANSEGMMHNNVVSNVIDRIDLYLNEFNIKRKFSQTQDPHRVNGKRTDTWVSEFTYEIPYEVSLIKKSVNRFKKFFN